MVFCSFNAFEILKIFKFIRYSIQAAFPLLQFHKSR